MDFFFLPLEKLARRPLGFAPEGTLFYPNEGGSSYPGRPNYSRQHSQARCDGSDQRASRLHTDYVDASISSMAGFVNVRRKRDEELRYETREATARSWGEVGLYNSSCDEIFAACIEERTGRRRAVLLGM